jgi:hypothetical protein
MYWKKMNGWKNVKSLSPDDRSVTVIYYWPRLSVAAWLSGKIIIALFVLVYFGTLSEAPIMQHQMKTRDKDGVGYGLPWSAAE